MSTIVAHIESKNKAKIKVTETKIDNPSRRSNFTFVTHPDKDEIILFGGEFHNGKHVSNFYNLKSFYFNIFLKKYKIVLFYLVCCFFRNKINLSFSLFFRQ